MQWYLTSGSRENVVGRNDRRAIKVIGQQSFWRFIVR